jgi:hypothetical protein
MLSISLGMNYAGSQFDRPFVYNFISNFSTTFNMQNQTKLLSGVSSSEILKDLKQLQVCKS